MFIISRHKVAVGGWTPFIKIFIRLSSLLLCPPSGGLSLPLWRCHGDVFHWCIVKVRDNIASVKQRDVWIRDVRQLAGPNRTPSILNRGTPLFGGIYM